MALLSLVSGGCFKKCFMNEFGTDIIHSYRKKILCAIMDCNTHYWFKQSCAAECLKYKFKSLNLPTLWEGPEPKVRNQCLKAERGNNSSDTNRPSCTLFERGSSRASLFLLESVHHLAGFQWNWGQIKAAYKDAAHGSARNELNLKGSRL